MARFIPKTFTDILQRMVARVVARSRLTDLETGGNVMTVLGAVARELDDVYYQQTNLQLLWSLDSCVGEDLDRRALDVNPDRLTRSPATKAVGAGTFGRSGTVGSVTIPAGHVVRVPTTDVEYVTSAAATIANGDTTSGLVTIVAREAGEDGNADAGTITEMDTYAGVDTFSNSTAATGGTDKEADDAFRDRIKLYMRSLPRGTPDALKFAALGVSADGYGRVVTADVVEFTGTRRGLVHVYVDDGQGTTEATADLGATPEAVVTATGGELRLFLSHKPIKQTQPVVLEWDDGGGPVVLVQNDDFTLNYATGQIDLIAGGSAGIPVAGLSPGDTVVCTDYTWYEGLIAEAQRVIDGDPGDRATYPGYRAGGVLVYVLAPTVYWQVIRASIVVQPGYVESEVIAQARAAIVRYINGLGINGDVVYTELVHQVQAVPGVYDVVFTQPVANVIIGEGELARVRTENILLAGA